MKDDQNDTDAPALPRVVDRATWQAEREALMVREKAHTREGDVIAAARRRLPIVEMDAIARRPGRTPRPAGRNGGTSDPQTLRTDGRPTAHWSRIAAGRSDELDSTKR